MNLDIVNDLFNNLKENNFTKSFMKELSNYLESSITNNKEIANADSSFNDIHLGNLTLYGEKIIVRYRDKMLSQRAEILQKYSESTKEREEMYYIYDINSNDSNSFNLCICEPERSHEVITKQKEELPEGVSLGSVLRKQDIGFILDDEGTKYVGKKINAMIKEKIEEQHEYLNSKRIEGHTYEVGEKYDGRIWLYDRDNVTNGGIEGIEEVEFPKELYQDAKKGDLFIYRNGEYYLKEK